jgi:outer membrane cobalamin receptor
LTTFRAAWGQYDQFPSGWQLNPDYGNPRLDPEYAYHSVLGAERKFGGGLFGRVEVYDKRYHRLVVGDEGEGNYANTGDGMARGVELFLKESIGERFFGWASYAWSVSKRKQRAGESWARYEYDQPHVATVVGSYALTPAWRVGAKFRYNSGPLYTPVVGRYQDANGDWQPIDGAPYSKRMSDYIRFDIRVEHAFRFSRWKLSLYADVLNVFGRSNPAGMGYSDDYSESRQYNNLPRLPYVGLSGQF